MIFRCFDIVATPFIFTIKMPNSVLLSDYPNAWTFLNKRRQTKLEQKNRISISDLSRVQHSIMQHYRPAIAVLFPPTFLYNDVSTVQCMHEKLRNHINRMRTKILYFPFYSYYFFRHHISHSSVCMLTLNMFVWLR